MCRKWQKTFHLISCLAEILYYRFYFTEIHCHTQNHILKFNSVVGKISLTHSLIGNQKKCVGRPNHIFLPVILLVLKESSPIVQGFPIFVLIYLKSAQSTRHGAISYLHLELHNSVSRFVIVLAR